MATQRWGIATLGGQSAAVVAACFDRWRASPDSDAVDRLCVTIQEHASRLPVLYYAEWMDRWLMGNIVPGPRAVAGHRFAATCLSASEALACAERRGDQFAEYEWLAARLREAADDWGGLAAPVVVVVVRDVVGPSVTDEEVREAAASVPTWLEEVC